MKRFAAAQEPWPKPIFSWKHEDFNPYIVQKLQWLDKNRMLLMGSHTVSILHIKRELASSLGEIDPWHIAAGKSLLLCVKRGDYVGLDSETYEIFRYRIVKRRLADFPDFREIDYHEVDAHELMIGMSPDDLTVALSRDNDLILLNPGDYSKIAAIKIDGPAELVSLSPSGRLLAVIGADLHLRIYQLDGLNQLWSSNAPVGTPCIFSPDERLVVFRDWDTRSDFIVAELDSEQTSRVIHVGDPDEFVRSVDISPDGLLLAAATRQDDPNAASRGYLRLFRLHDDLEVACMQSNSDGEPAPVHVAFSTDAKHLTSICIDGTVRVWSVLSGGALWRLRKRFARMMDRLLARPEPELDPYNEYELRAFLRRFGERALWASYMAFYSVFSVVLILGGFPIWVIIMWLLLIPGLLCCFLGSMRR